MTEDEPSESREDIMDALEEIRDSIGDVDLEPTEPWEAFELWLDQQRGEKSTATIDTYERRVRPFIEFLTGTCGIGNLNDVTSRHVKAYEAHRKQELAVNTQNNQFGTIRLFLRYARDLDAIHPDVVDALDVPGLSKSERVNTEKLPSQRATEILEYLDRFEYASRRHVMFLLLWRTTMRIGTLHSLDVDDLYLTNEDQVRLRQELEDAGHEEAVIEELVEQAPFPFIWPRHRPDDGAAGLKKDWEGERTIGIQDWVADVLADYLRVNRGELTDEDDRRPLLPSRKGTGRLSASAIRNWCYILTQPCEFGDPCPYGEDPETCEAREHGHGSKCPGAKSPHKVRTGSITWHRDQGWPPGPLAERANTSQQMIRDVYDQPEKLIRGANRRRFVDQLDGSGSEGDSA